MDERKKCGVEIDMLSSSLPDELLVHILSLLPLKTSVSTSILSRRWLHLWKYTTKLNFTFYEMKWLNSVLKSHRATSLQEFTIDFFFETESHCHDLAKWLDFAFSRRVETLGLNFNGGDPRLEDITTLLVPTTRSLKVLRLLETEISCDSIKFFLGNCPVLEELYIICAAITSDVVELVGPSLRYLELERLFKRNKFPIKVYAPKLTMIKISLDTDLIVLESVPKLVDMVFRCSAGATMHGFAAAASQLETLSIFIDDIKEPFWIPEMPKLKSLVIDNCYHRPPFGIVPFPVTYFLKASPCLQEFHVKFTRLDLVTGETEVPKGCLVFRHSCLKRFKLLWFCVDVSNRDDHIKLVRYVVESCVALEEIQISRCDGTNLGGIYYIVVDDDNSVRAATTEERMSFENTTQMQLPAHINLRIVNHSHRSR